MRCRWPVMALHLAWAARGGQDDADATRSPHVRGSDGPRRAVSARTQAVDEGKR
jgi:hypothetical protein